MNHENFSASLKEFAPRQKPKAIQIWEDFAAECVEMGQYVNFDISLDRSLAVEKWLDVLCTGFCAVKEAFGEDIVTKLIDLSCEKCCLYPGEMMQAAVLLDNGWDARDILALINDDGFDPPTLFSPMSREEALESMAPETSAPKPSILEQLGRPENDGSPAKRKTTKERGPER